MKAHAIETRSAQPAAFAWRGDPSSIAAGLVAQARGLEIVARLATRLFLVLLPALAVVVLATLAASSPELALFLQVGLWTGGFLFYALAMDAEKIVFAALLVGSGLALQALAWMSGHLGPELAVAGAGVVATWIAIGIARTVLTRH